MMNWDVFRGELGEYGLVHLSWHSYGQGPPQYLDSRGAMLNYHSSRVGLPVVAGAGRTHRPERAHGATRDLSTIMSTKDKYRKL